MTREEYLESLRTNPLKSNELDCVVIMSRYINELEQRIAELEAENARISMHLDRERDDAVHYCKVIAEL